jgi:hypothetical protein
MVIDDGFLKFATMTQSAALILLTPVNFIVAAYARIKGIAMTDIMMAAHETAIPARRALILDRARVPLAGFASLIWDDFLV